MDLPLAVESAYTNGHLPNGPDTRTSPPIKDFWTAWGDANSNFLIVSGEEKILCGSSARTKRSAVSQKRRLSRRAHKKNTKGSCFHSSVWLTPFSIDGARLLHVRVEVPISQASPPRIAVGHFHWNSVLLPPQPLKICFCLRRWNQQKVNRDTSKARCVVAVSASS